MTNRKKKKSIPQLYQSATQALQNYGRNIGKNIAQGQANLRSGKASTYGAINPFPNPLKGASYKSKKRPRLGVNNKMKGSYGETIIQKGKRPIIKINVKKHKGDKAELADTIKHELMHAKHPKMHEKTVYKKVPKNISPSEQNNLISRLKKNNYKRGAIKRKLKIARGEKLQPGDLIKRSRAMSRTTRVAIMGAG